MDIPEHLHAIVDQLGQALVSAMVNDPECQALVAQIQAEGFEVALMLEATVAIQRRKALEGAQGEGGAEDGADPHAVHPETQVQLFGDVSEQDAAHKPLTGENFSEADKAFLRTFKISLD